jgi:20S proteasome alpha/beta subunit
VQQQAEAEWIKGTSREPNLIEALFAGVSDDGRPWIYEVTCNGGDEEHDLAEAIGAGRVYAMSALMALRHHGFEDLENRQVHVLAYRAINDAIATAAHEIGISGPIHMHIAEQRGALPLQDEAIKVIRYEMISQQQQEREIFRKPGGSLDKSESAGIDPPPAASRTMTT